MIFFRILYCFRSNYFKELDYEHSRKEKVEYDINTESPSDISVSFKKIHVFGSCYDVQRPINGHSLGQRQELLTTSISINLKVGSIVI